VKKYVTLKCSICKRSVDSLINLTHYSPDRCTITLNCEGRLAPDGYTSDGTSAISVPPVGLVNWYPRGSTIKTTFALGSDVLYNTSTGTKQQAVLAVPDSVLGFSPGLQAKVKITLIAEKQSAKDFRQYTYRRSTQFSSVNGVEDTVAKKVLRYSLTGAVPDHVEVYVNGVKRDVGTGALDFQLNDGTPASAVPPNSILFNSPVTGSNSQVDVVVTKASALSTVTMEFSRAAADESKRGTGAWEGVDAVSSASLGQCSLFYLDFTEISSAFALDIKLRYSSAVLQNTPSTAAVNCAGAALLLSRTTVHTELDRERSVYAPLLGLNTDTEYMVIKLLNGVRALFITESAVQPVFPALKVQRFNAPSLELINLAGNLDAAMLDNTLIIGPDS
jgi:hypothetical protein